MPDNDEIHNTLERRLKVLQMQAATYGAAAVPAHIVMEIEDILRQLAPPAPPPTTQKHHEWIVDAMHRGDFATISEAIAAAKDGDVIRVRPGLYEESLQITKVLEIIGDGDRNEIEVHAEGAHTIVFAARHGYIRGLTLRQNGSEGNWSGVDITGGRLTLEECDISSQSSVCIAIGNGAKPIVRNNHIHNGKNAGIVVYNHGAGLIEGNDIVANAGAGIAIKTGGNPTVRNNRIHDGKGSGIFVQENGAGLIEGNDIAANAPAGIEIKTGGNPTVRTNRIQNNTFQAIWIHGGGRGTFSGNDLRGNKRGAWVVAKDCLPHITRRDNQE